MILINGLLMGGIFAMLAIGFSLIFGVAKILSLVHTALYMTTAFLVFIALGRFEDYPVIVIISAVLITGLIAMACYIIFLDRVKQHGTAVMIISLALAIIFQEVLLWIFGGHFRSIPAFLPGYVEIMGVRVLYQHFFSIGASFVTILAVWLLLYKSNLGKAIRAVSDDMEVANLMGINVSRVCLVTMGISGALAGIAGVVSAPLTPVHPLMWMPALLTILAAVVLGGLGSIKGSIIGAFLLGFAETSVVFMVPKGAFLKGAVSLSVMIALLIIRPEGLFGVAFEEERL
ncbi:MAG: branched-chain amino acid ABC transporter permease [Thermodesulfobacteriota bacterium]|nr:branched-chain amino acid ABC transporter permease [Thermodesulfobacteriota bacterium]